MYSQEYDSAWAEHFAELSPDMKERVAKRIKKILEQPSKRHLKGSAKFFVAEAGQYRIVYRIINLEQKVRFYFVGTHKDYENWYGQFP